MDTSFPYFQVWFMHMIFTGIMGIQHLCPIILLLHTLLKNWRCLRNKYVTQSKSLTRQILIVYWSFQVTKVPGGWIDWLLNVAFNDISIVYKSQPVCIKTEYFTHKRNPLLCFTRKPQWVQYRIFLQHHISPLCPWHLALIIIVSAKFYDDSLKLNLTFAHFWP